MKNFIVKLGVSSSQMDFVLTFVKVTADESSIYEVFLCSTSNETSFLLSRTSETLWSVDLHCNPVRQFVNRLKNAFYDLANIQSKTFSEEHEHQLWWSCNSSTKYVWGYSFILNYEVSAIPIHLVRFSQEYICCWSTDALMKHGMKYSSAAKGP